MLLDSNVIISAAKPEYPALREFIAAAQSPLAASAVSHVEALGYHRLTAAERAVLEDFFAAAIVHPVTPAVIDRAVALRQARKMSLGDALIAATALVHGLTLVTRNVRDFDWIEGLPLIDPLAAG